MKYIIVTIILFAASRLYFLLARHYRIVDKPKERSSHKRLTIRGGGIIFPLAAILWFLFFGFKEIWPLAGLLIISVISFLDDLFSLSGRLRLVAHVTAAGLLFYGTDLYMLPAWLWIIVFIAAVGWINLFNFMDGINGITSFYTLVFLCSLLFITSLVEFTNVDFLLVMIISVLIFGFYNARKKAAVFAGDVGSVTLAYIVVWLTIRLITETGRIEYLLFLSIYGIDSGFTIFFRLFRGENIFKAHRMHLYQYLSNELKWPHLKVAALYGGNQLIINVLTIWLISNNRMNIIVFAGILLIFSTLYLYSRFKVMKVIEKKDITG